MQVVMFTIAVSTVTSIITAAFITIIGCWLFRNWLEGEMNRMFDEEGIRTDKHIFEMTAAITELTRNTNLNKKGNTRRM